MFIDMEIRWRLTGVSLQVNEGILGDAMRLQCILDWVQVFWENEDEEDFFFVSVDLLGDVTEAVQHLLRGFNTLLDGHRKQFGIATDKKPAKVK
jgi:hypothetical protein